MDVEKKKTVLDDDAGIYQKRKNVYTKDDVKEMSRKEQFKYFKDYYLKKVILVIVGIIAVCVLVRDIVFNRTQPALSIACLNECSIGNSQALEDAVAEYIHIKDESTPVTIASYNTTNTDSNMSYVTLASSGAIDIVICPYDYFIAESQAGTFVDFSEVLSEDEYAQIADKTLEAGIIETDIDGTIISSGDPAPYGIDISNSKYFKEYCLADEQIVLCVINGTENTDNALKAISYFTEE